MVFRVERSDAKAPPRNEGAWGAWRNPRDLSAPASLQVDRELVVPAERAERTKDATDGLVSRGKLTFVRSVPRPYWLRWRCAKQLAFRYTRERSLLWRSNSRSLSTSSRRRSMC